MYLLLFHLIAIPSICALLLAALTLCGVNIPLLTGEPLEGSREQTFSIKEAIPPGEAERLRSLQEEMLRRSNSEGDDTDSASKTENADSEEQAETLWVYPGSQIIGDDDDAVTFTFAGDLLLDPYYATGSTAQSIGLAACFDDASLSVMRDSDIFVVNNEFPYTDSNVPQENKQFTFHAPPSAAAMLNDIGADLALLANNHMYDYKAIGVTDTVNALDAAGIPHIGAGRNIAEASRPQVYTIHSENAEPFTVAIINATQVEQYATPNTLPATESDPGVFRFCHRHSPLGNGKGRRDPVPPGGSGAGYGRAWRGSDHWRPSAYSAAHRVCKRGACRVQPWQLPFYLLFAGHRSCQDHSPALHALPRLFTVYSHAAGQLPCENCGRSRKRPHPAVCAEYVQRDSDRWGGVCDAGSITE